MYCNHCGAELKEGAKFCPHCGTAIEVVDVRAGEAISHAPIPEPVDAKRARRAARHRVLGGFPLFLVCLGFAQSIYLFVSGGVLLVYTLSLPPLYAYEWMRFVLYGAAAGYGLAGLFQLISAVLLLRRGRRFLAPYAISAVLDVLTLVALLVVFVMGGISFWPTIVNIAVVVVAFVLVLVYRAKSSRLRAFLGLEDRASEAPSPSGGM